MWLKLCHSSTVWAEAFHFRGQHRASFLFSTFFFFFNVSVKSVQLAPRRFDEKRLFAHVRYILIAEYAHILRLLLKIYQEMGLGDKDIPSSENLPKF